MAEPYGGIVLGRSGTEVSQKTKLNPDYVKELKKDLYTLGFCIVGKEPPGGYNGTFNHLTEWAVRDFQIYAGMEYVAKLDPDLSNIPRSYEAFQLTEIETKSDRYTGPISGVVNSKTAKSIKLWIDKKWRCPVVACAFVRDSNFRATGEIAPQKSGGDELAINLWDGSIGYRDTKAKPAIVYTRDFTRYYCVPGQSPAQVQLSS